MASILGQLTNYLTTNLHWWHLALMLVGIGLVATGMGLWWQANRKPEVIKPEMGRQYRREIEVGLADLDRLPQEDKG